MSKSLKQMAYDTIEAHQETIADLRTQLAKSNERVAELEKQFETQMTNDFVTITDQAKRITELEKYNLDLANESHSKSLEIDKANERVKELEISLGRLRAEILHACVEGSSSSGGIKKSAAHNLHNQALMIPPYAEQLRKEQENG